MYIAKAEEGYQPPSIYVEDKLYSDFNLHTVIKQNLARKGYKYPTVIQDRTIPVISEGHDVLGLASTGSGKTNAFLIPMLDKTIRRQSDRCLIIVPTRELAVQIQDEFRTLAAGSRVHSTVVIGGASMGAQIGNLRRNPQFVIGTPGRLKDLFERKVLDLSQFNNIVLDEVDRMLDMGFVPVITFLISKLPQDRQSLFFSATMSRDAERIAHTLLRDPVTIQIEKEAAHKNVHQDIVPVSSNDEKVTVLSKLLSQDDFSKVLVFSRTKHGADRLSRRLSQNGHKVDSIHGGKTQNRRLRVLSEFRSNRINVLIATDVAARGLDIENVSHVINYDEPENYKDYIHRIGRTGRAGKAGIALTFVVGTAS
ncbi:MAG: ATP-dependent RNA helicase RhlE [candidate division WS6 bacterium OLB20]|uniref:ATP-dependent RNA helicase RhlE n=1 Tax=candidate division WS6 bacterium OLB20 TaxID=1617426 RepID=A0A136LWJ3_9BACT|nr:MAG: ATP-dependent RNA helicase RhlE [candidate division WS6 bacterium OLB20]